MRRVLTPLAFLLISMLIFSDCGVFKQKDTITSIVTETQPTKTITSTIATTTTIISTTSQTTKTTTYPTITTYTTPPPITTTAPTTSEPPTTTVTTPTAVVDLSNVTLIGTHNGFNIVDGQGFSALTDAFGQILDAVVDDRERVWAVTGSSIMVFNGISWKPQGRPQGVYTLEAITTDLDGRIWIGHYEGVSVLDGEQWRSYSSDTFGLGEFSSLIKDIAIDHQNRIWVATSAGVAVLNGDSWIPYDETSGLTYNIVEAIMVDHQGKVWVAHSYGVDVFDGNSWVFYGKKYDKTAQIEVEKLTGVKALAEDDGGHIWVGTSTNGVSVFDGSTWQTYDGREHFYGAGVNSLACDRRGRTWMGTNFGLTVFDGSSWYQYTKNSSVLLSNDIGIVLVTGDGPLSLPTARALETGSIQGKIKSGDQPLAGAKVVVCWQAAMFYSGSSPCSGDSYSAITNENGDFYISGVPPYRYALAIQKPDGSWKIKLGWVYIVDGEATFLGTLSI